MRKFRSWHKIPCIILASIILMLSVACDESTPEPPIYLVSFDSAGGSFVSPVSVVEGELLVRPGDPVREGYEFLGWYLGNQPFDFSTPVTGKITLQAHWQKKVKIWAVEFDSVGGSAVSTSYVVDGEKLPVPDSPFKSGYIFKDWFLYGDSYDFSSPVHSNLVLTAVWNKVYTITFDSNGGSDVESQLIEAGNCAVAPAFPNKAGYTFDGWYCGNEIFDFTKSVESDLVLVAHWKEVPPQMFVVTFVTDRGSFVPSQSVYSGSCANEPVEPELNGYVFKGWLCNGQPYDFSTPVTGNIILTANWSKLHTVSFVTGGGTDVASQSVENGYCVEMPESPYREGYVFKEWLFNNAPFDFNTPVRSDISLTARWTRLFTVTFDSAGGGDVSPMYVEDGLCLENAPIPERDGYAFKGWMKNGKPFSSDTAIIDDVNLVASWVKLITITFDTSGGIPEIPVQVIEAYTIPQKPETPSKDGYAFKEWRLKYPVENGSDAGVYDFTRKLSQDMKIVAYWTPLHTIYFDSAGGSPVESIDVKEDEWISLNDVSTMRDGYVFKGWFDNNGNQYRSAKLTSDLYLTAHWNELFTVVFDLGNGHVFDSQSVECGFKVGMPETPSKDGFLFRGWMLDGEDFDPNDPITDNITLTAKWVESCTLAFDSAGGSSVDSMFVEKGVAIGSLPIPERNGYRFDGWTCNGQFVDGSYVITEDMNLIAAWTEVVNVAFVLDNRIYKDLLVEKGTTISTIDIPTPNVSGTFFYWCQNPGKEGGFDYETIVEEDLSLYAVYLPEEVEYEVDSDGWITVVKCNPDVSGSIILPYETRKISEKAFMECSGLTSIILPEGLTEIANNTFSYCNNLTCVNIPSTVTSIGNHAFYKTSLESISLPDRLNRIGINAFGYCDFSSVIIPESVLEISTSAFSSCSNLRKVEFRGQLEQIGSSIFYDCVQLDNIIIPSTVISIGDYAFKNCTSLKTVEFPPGLESIGVKSFYNIAIEELILPDSIKAIGSRAFSGCDQLVSVVVPDSIKSIDDVFIGCSELESVELPDTLESMRNAFQACDNLKYIAIPKGVTSLEGSFEFSGLVSIDIPENITTIDRAFASCDDLTEVIIPGNVESMEHAFSQCENLLKVTIEDGVTEISGNAFSYCLKLEEVHLPESLKTIDEYAFFYTSLESIVIPDQVGCIDYAAFANCSELNYLVLPANLGTIGESAFVNCSKLNYLVLPANLETIGESAFAHCVSLTSIRLPDTTRELLAGCFSGCESLIFFDLSGCSPNIYIQTAEDSNGVFSNCTNLADVYLPDGFDPDKVERADWWGAEITTEFHFGPPES